LERETRIAEERQKEDDARILEEGLCLRERDDAHAERQHLERVVAIWTKRGRQEEVENWVKGSPPSVRGYIFFLFWIPSDRSFSLGLYRVR
jgi:hypothetical protein